MKPRQRRLTGQVEAVRQAVIDQLERRVAAERVVIVLVLVVRQNAIDPLTDHRQIRVQHLTRARPLAPQNALLTPQFCGRIA